MQTKVMKESNPKQMHTIKQISLDIQLEHKKIYPNKQFSNLGAI